MLKNLKIEIDNEAAKALQKMPGMLEAALERASIAALVLLEGAVLEHTPVGATGFLARGIFSELAPRPEFGGIVDVHPPANAYAAPVEFGSKAHFPPSSALFAWVKEKFGLSDKGEIERAAFAVALKIAGRLKGKPGGTPAREMFGKAFAEQSENVNLLFDQEIEKALEALRSD